MFILKSQAHSKTNMEVKLVVEGQHYQNEICPSDIFIIRRSIIKTLSQKKYITITKFTGDVLTKK